MIEWLAGRNRRLLVRSYFFLAGGLIVAAVVLDFGFNTLQEREARAQDPWLESTFRLIETELAAAPDGSREAVARDLARRLGMQVRVLGAGDIAAAFPGGEGTQELVDGSGNTYYLRRSAAFDGAVRVGPIRAPPDNALLRFLPAAFYLSILVVVGLWLRPLLRDLRVMTDASQKFAADYREPLDTVARTTQLTSLAKNLDDMSARIGQLIQNQKELTAALSHEMRTPLARIRFALAVIGNQAGESLQSQLREVNADVQQIDDLIANMLHYARLDHPGLRMEWQDTPLDPWLRHALAACSSPGRSLEVFRAAGFESAWMEPRLMELALSNLVANAFRYARSRVAVTLSRDAGGHRIVVEDDGEGIPEGERDAVFKAFARLDTSRNRDTGGFGLGLAIVARIAALHQGRVSAAASERLGGARLVVEWPLLGARSRMGSAG